MRIFSLNYSKYRNIIIWHGIFPSNQKQEVKVVDADPGSRTNNTKKYADTVNMRGFCSF